MTCFKTSARSRHESADAVSWLTLAFKCWKCQISSCYLEPNVFRYEADSRCYIVFLVGAVTTLLFCEITWFFSPTHADTLVPKLSENEFKAVRFMSTRKDPISIQRCRSSRFEPVLCPPVLARTDAAEFCLLAALVVRGQPDDKSSLNGR